MAHSILKRDGYPDLAYHFYTGEDRSLPLVMFCGGYKSDMGGTKATYLEDFCQSRDQSYLRFDYSGHGASGGDFEEGTIGSWANDALDIYRKCADGHPVILVGSSMGGWVSLLLSLKLGDSLKGMIGIAAAPDFTVRLWHEDFNDEQRGIMDRDGRIEIPNDYSDEPYIFTKALIHDGEQNQLLNQQHDMNAPIILLQGKQDADVPWQTAEAIKKSFSNVRIVYIDDGDHRLSRSQDLDLLAQEIIVLS